MSAKEIKGLFSNMSREFFICHCIQTNYKAYPAVFPPSAYRGALSQAVNWLGMKLTLLTDKG
jgi:hypothetical protein